MLFLRVFIISFTSTLTIITYFNAVFLAKQRDPRMAWHSSFLPKDLRNLPFVSLIDLKIFWDFMTSKIWTFRLNAANFSRSPVQKPATTFGEFKKQQSSAMFIRGSEKKAAVSTASVSSAGGSGGKANPSTTRISRDLSLLSLGKRGSMRNELSIASSVDSPVSGNL